MVRKAFSERLEMELMSWSVDFDDDDSVSLVHENGFLIFAKKGLERDDHTDWRIEIRNTSTGEELVQKTHQISNRQHLWSVLDKYTELYPP